MPRHGPRPRLPLVRRCPRSALSAWPLVEMQLSGICGSPEPAELQLDAGAPCDVQTRAVRAPVRPGSSRPAAARPVRLTFWSPCPVRRAVRHARLVRGASRCPGTRPRSRPVSVLRVARRPYRCARRGWRHRRRSWVARRCSWSTRSAASSGASLSGLLRCRWSVAEMQLRGSCGSPCPAELHLGVDDGQAAELTAAGAGCVGRVGPNRRCRPAPRCSSGLCTVCRTPLRCISAWEPRRPGPSG